MVNEQALKNKVDMSKVQDLFNEDEMLDQMKQAGNIVMSDEEYDDEDDDSDDEEGEHEQVEDEEGEAE